MIIIARFIVEFLAIHPFQDGNGRLSRALTTLLVLRAAYEYVPYASHKCVVEENKLRYYAAPRESQLAMRDDPAAFGTWAVFFLGALRAQKRALEAKVDVERPVLQLSGVQERIVAAVRSHGRATTRTLAQQLGLPDRTIRYHLELLVARNLLTAHGERKRRYYTPGGGDGVAPRYDGRVVGLLHGRRLPHLKRDPRTKESILTARGEVLARHEFGRQEPALCAVCHRFPPGARRRRLPRRARSWPKRRVPSGALWVVPPCATVCWPADQSAAAGMTTRTRIFAHRYLNSTSTFTQ